MKNRLKCINISTVYIIHKMSNLPLMMTNDGIVFLNERTQAILCHRVSPSDTRVHSVTQWPHSSWYHSSTPECPLSHSDKGTSGVTQWPHSSECHPVIQQQPVSPSHPTAIPEFPLSLSDPTAADVTQLPQSGWCHQVTLTTASINQKSHSAWCHPATSECPLSPSDSRAPIVPLLSHQKKVSGRKPPQIQFLTSPCTHWMTSLSLCRRPSQRQAMLSTSVVVLREVIHQRIHPVSSDVVHISHGLQQSPLCYS